MDRNVSKKRLFVAIDLAAGIKEKIYENSKIFLSNNKNIKLVRCENIHITLKFLGNIEVDFIPLLKKALKQSVKDFRAFSFQINSHIDAFPNASKASIIFVGIKEGSSEIGELFKKTELELAKIKICREKREFMPHATLARTRKRTDITEIKENIYFNELPIGKCDRITLFESKLEFTGAVYLKLNEFFLK